MTGSIFRALLLLASARQALSSCAYGTFLKPRAEEGDVPISNFGYTGVVGPLNWAALDAANGACIAGSHQSPINMVQGAFTEIPACDFSLEVPDFIDGAEFENLGSTVEVVARSGTLVFGGKPRFTLRQFHFHLPSEHLDNGKSQAMEMHMVWQSEMNEIAVIGVYINVATEATAISLELDIDGVEKRGQDGAPTVLLETIFSVIGDIALPGTKVETPPLIMSEVIDQLKAGSFQAYNGSLTTPPCSEGVNWLVSTTKLAISPATFAKVRDVIGFNARFAQNTPGQPNILQLGTSGRAQNQTAY